MGLGFNFLLPDDAGSVGFPYHLLVKELGQVFEKRQFLLVWASLHGSTGGGYLVAFGGLVFD